MEKNIVCATKVFEIWFVDIFYLVSVSGDNPRLNWYIYTETRYKLKPYTDASRLFKLFRIVEHLPASVIFEYVRLILCARANCFLCICLLVFSFIFGHNCLHVQEYIAIKRCTCILVTLIFGWSVDQNNLQIQPILTIRTSRIFVESACS